MVTASFIRQSRWKRSVLNARKFAETSFAEHFQSIYRCLWELEFDGNLTDYELFASRLRRTLELFQIIIVLEIIIIEFIYSINVAYRLRWTPFSIHRIFAWLHFRMFQEIYTQESDRVFNWNHVVVIGTYWGLDFLIIIASRKQK